MRTLVHLSDLHFGRVDPAIPPALLSAVAAIAPDLVVISGDFTQRARISEYRAAAEFLAAIAHPLLLVPGNHDVPLYDVLRRSMAPFHRYKRYITSDLAPFHADAEIAVLGINTARALTFKNGRINAAQLAAAVARLATYGPEVTRVIVTHHPFDTPDPAAAGVLGRAPMAIAAFLRSRVDLVLSGHLHVSRVNRTAERPNLPGYTALLVQAGTATSTRQRGEVNAFNLVRIARPRIEIVAMVWDAAAARFTPAAPEVFQNTGAGWAPVAA